MKKKNSFIQILLVSGAVLLTSFLPVFGQQMPGGAAPGVGKGGFDPSKMNTGRFYGKVTDESGKGIGYATVALEGLTFDTLSKTLKSSVITGQLTEDNGDFNLEKLPTVGDFTLIISFLGYAEVRQQVTFGVKPPMQGGTAPGAAPGGMPGGGFPQGGFGGGGGVEKDLGNIRLTQTSTVLKEVTIRGEASKMTLAFDRKVYRVDKDATSAGGNAVDALKNVPSLSVDLDGNVSLRNGAPQIFVDGKPTTLSLDQIASDAIESVEVITNPSAKFDAGGGTAGIVNIVLKKGKRLGYNGNVRTGTDSRTGYNFGGDVNARSEKTNLFASGNFNRMNGFSDGKTVRQNLIGDPLTNSTQTIDNGMHGFFANGRAGLDWFMSNRNTLTFNVNYTRGSFNPDDVLDVRFDSLFVSGVASGGYVRTVDQARNFRNVGTTFQFKHLFPKEGAEWTSDLNYNRVRFHGESDYMTQFDNGIESMERQNGKGRGQFITAQTDFVNPLGKGFKLEGGLKASLRRNKNDTENEFFNSDLQVWEPVTNLADHYKFSDDVYAAYLQTGKQMGKWGVQAGLRAEGSVYKGSLTDQDSSFTIAYPLSLFPSVFLTRTLTGGDQLQFSYTRRVNRPNFFQTMPFTDFSDSLNLRRGNPQLRPEFMNSLEISYQNVISPAHSLLLSVYYKHVDDLITTYFINEFNADLNRNVVVSTYANSNSSQAYGAEFTLKNNFFKIIDLSTNFNIFQTKVDAGNVEADLQIERVSWFLKENLSIKLPAAFTFQITGEYRSKASFTPNTGNQMPWMPGPTNTAQGYTLSNWYVDMALKKEILKQKGTITLNINDVFATRRQGTYTESGLFIQHSQRTRDPQIVRLNLSYRFGKMDMSLFKRKNMKMNMQGNDMMQ